TATATGSADDDGRVAPDHIRILRLRVHRIGVEVELDDAGFAFRLGAPAAATATAAESTAATAGANSISEPVRGFRLERFVAEHERAFIAGAAGGKIAAREQP